MQYQDGYELLDNKIFEKMAREYYQKQANFSNVEVLKFDKKSCFKSQFEQVLNIIYCINLKQNKREKLPYFLPKNIAYKLQLEQLNKEMFLFYQKLFKKNYLMPIATRLSFDSKKDCFLNDYFRLIKALIDCDFYLLDGVDKEYFKGVIFKYFKLVFKCFC